MTDDTRPPLPVEEDPDLQTRTLTFLGELVGWLLILAGLPVYRLTVVYADPSEMATILVVGAVLILVAGMRRIRIEQRRQHAQLLEELRRRP